ncbi:serine hydrolase [Coralloluteibacterium thermophilus]|uniref:Serine hydrolase n=1 Tax=Coralloluteibacterium thermophilum TaxID=2707049 RepID=A0ABV9NP92_9GAMM
MHLRPLAFALAALLATAAPAVPAQAPAPTAAATRDAAAVFADLDAYVAEVQARFDVPGVVVAIVQDGEVVLARGWGVRELGRPEPVDAHTLFAIASNTKAFTAAALSILADDGRLSLDDRVIQHLPWFRMSDAYVTGEMRLRDLLTHRSGLGLGAGDLLFWPATTYSNREVVERLAHVPLAGGFREKYAYDNILYGVAQQVVETVSGQSFAEFLQARIFDRLDMRETRFNADHLRPDDAAATGHAKADFTELAPVAPLTWANVAGAGGLYSSAHDMAKWMRVQLAGGVIRGEGEDAERLFSAARHRAMWSLVTPQTIPEPRVPELRRATPNFAGYGEGWSLSDYRGEKLVWHTGGWPGMVSRLTLVPGRNAGVVVLTNAEAGAAFQAITMRVLDRLLDAPDHDWPGAYAAALGRQHDEAAEDWARHEAARDRRSTPSLPLAGYAATYRDPWYGDIHVVQEGRGLVMRFARTPQLVGDLEHWQHDTFIVRWRDRQLNADAFLGFALTPDGAVREARMEAISPLTDFSFDFHDLRLTPVAED